MNLKLLQLGDSALPVGGYSHSWGLEAAVERGTVRDAADLERWARHWLRDAFVPLEGVIVAAVCRAVHAADWPTVHEANELLAASLTPPTLRHASADMGEQLTALADCWPWAPADALRRIPTPRHHAVVFGVLAAAAGTAPGEALKVFLHQAALGLIGAGVRSIPIGHTHGQQVLARLHEELLELADRVQARDLATVGASCPAYEVLCDEQSQLYTRIFRS